MMPLAAPAEVIDNEGVRARWAPTCLLCESEGKVLYAGQRDRLFSAPGVWSIRWCGACGLAWLDPKPLPEEIGKLYTEYFTHELPSALPRFADLRRYIGEAIRATWLGYREQTRGLVHGAVGWLLGLPPPIREVAALALMELPANRRGRVVDVGCGNGQFLARMRDLGWEVLGVEPDAHAARLAAERFGLTVVPSTLEEASLPDDSVDAVTMSHVIEHVPDPVGLLAECRRVLKPGGAVVVVTPNTQSLGRRIFHEAWLGWDVPRHITLFSVRALCTCAELAGLKVIRLRTTARTARWMWAASRVIQRQGRLPGGSIENPTWRLRLEGLGFQAIEQLSLGGLVLDLGEEIVLTATKE